MAERYLSRVLEGLPIEGLEIIDAHQHLGPYFNFSIARDGSVDAMVERADMIGIGKMCVSPHAGITTDMTLGNEDAMQAIAAYPGRVFGYVSIKPAGEEEMMREIERCFAVKGFVGFKLHPGLHGVDVANASYRPAMEYADRHAVPTLIHTWSHADVADVDALAGRYPNAPLILAHMGGAPNVLDHALEVMKRRDNVFGDTALSYAPHGNIEYAVKKAGAEKVIFGTDMTFYDPVFTLARVVCADIPESDVEKIVGGNFRSICPPIRG